MEGRQQVARITFEVEDTLRRCYQRYGGPLIVCSRWSTGAMPSGIGWSQIRTMRISLCPAICRIANVDRAAHGACREKSADVVIRIARVIESAHAACRGVYASLVQSENRRRRLMSYKR